MSREAEEEALERLLFHLENQTGFWFALVVAEAPAPRDRLRQAAEAWCEAHGKPFSFFGESPDHLGALASALAKGSLHGLCWIKVDHRAGITKTWSEGAAELFLAMNERREAYRKRLDAGVIVEGPDALKRLLRELGPDMFSIRSFIAEPGLEEDQPDAVVAEWPPAKRGSTEEKLAGSGESGGGLRRLVGQDSVWFLLKFAEELESLVDKQEGRGEHHGALASAHEAVAIRRQLVAADLKPFLSFLRAYASPRPQLNQDPEAYWRDFSERFVDRLSRELGESLRRLSNVQDALGQREDALRPIQEAVPLWRQLSERHPETYLPILAIGIEILGLKQMELAQWDDAVASAREAVQLNRKLASERPEAFLPGLACSLDTLGKILGDLGHRADALAATQEAVEHYRKLAAERPEEFLPLLTESLRTLTAIQAEPPRELS